MGFNLSVFVGARFGLFCYNALAASESNSTGYADFDWFTTEDTFEESMFYPDDGSQATISTIEHDTQDVELSYYDLQGRRVDSPQKAGVYIKNGKKHLIK